ncbi:MAG: glycosyltransferase family 2 protein [Actinomycetota bacterium]|nr:glycosyltransferase family 2 protein [Actinomycetota bacterium]
MTGSSDDRPPLLSIIVVTWNSVGVVSSCLQSLLEHPPSVAWELIVVDNGSTDGTAAQVHSDLPDVTVIANTHNRGLPAANNQGMVSAHGALFLICNPDVLFETGAVDALIAVLHRHPEAGWVVPRLRYPDGGAQTSAGDLPSLGEALLGRQLGRRRSPGTPRGFWWDGWPHDQERQIGRGHEAAYLVRRHAVTQVGLQDERYVLDWEGIDWTDRFRQGGWQVWLAPAANVTHLGGASIRQVPVRWIVSQHRGMYRYFSRRRPRSWRPGLAALFFLRAAAKVATLGTGAPLYEWAHRDRRDVARR